MFQHINFYIPSHRVSALLLQTLLILIRQQTHLYYTHPKNLNYFTTSLHTARKVLSESLTLTLTKFQAITIRWHKPQVDIKNMRNTTMRWGSFVAHLRIITSSCVSKRFTWRGYLPPKESLWDYFDNDFAVSSCWW